MTAFQSYGRVVYCKYNDFRFKSCVLSDHRGQVLHQAMVTGFFYGLCVVALAGDEKTQELYKSLYVKLKCRISMYTTTIYSRRGQGYLDGSMKGNQ